MGQEEKDAESGQDRLKARLWIAWWVAFFVSYMLLVGVWVAEEFVAAAIAAAVSATVAEVVPVQDIRRFRPRLRWVPARLSSAPLDPVRLRSRLSSAVAPPREA